MTKSFERSAAERAPEILEILKKTYPKATCELNFKNPLELLVATILSAQCTDVRVNEVTPKLFLKYKTAKDYAKANVSDLESIIRPTGFFRNKARAIQDCCTQLTMEHGSEVPKEIDALVKLAGVGRKTANVVRAYAYGLPGIICDTHVLRITERLALTKNKDPDKVEQDIMKLLPEKDWTMFSSSVVFHGRRCCYARNPECQTCPVFKLCPFGNSE